MLAFVHIYKNAGTTWNAVLRRNYGSHHFDSRVIPGSRMMTAADLRRLLRIAPKLCSIAGHEIRPHADLHEAVPDLRYYTFLREPVARAFSSFQYRMFCRIYKGAGPWSASALQQALLASIAADGDNQTLYLAGTQDADLAIATIEERLAFTGLVERFDESLVLMRRLLNAPELDCRYHRLNMSSDRGSGGSRVVQALEPVNDFIARQRENPETLERIRLANGHDSRLYAHVSQVVYPRAVAAYGATLSADVQDFRVRCRQLRFRRRESLLAKAHRNLVIKPIRKVLFPDRNALPAAA